MSMTLLLSTKLADWIRTPIFSAPTARRRMINTAILLVLVSTLIPYQFAYMVACIVQLATCVRAQWHAKETVHIIHLLND